MKYLRLAIIVLVSGLVLTAQAAATKNSGYLSDYARLNKGEHLKAYWVDIAKIEKSAAPRMLLGEISVTRIKDHKGVTVADCLGWLKRDLLERAVISDSHSDAKYRVDLAITYMDPGSRRKRVWAGEFGAGHAKLQIEGKVIDIKRGQVVATFAERKQSSGALGARDLRGDAGPRLIEHLVKLISADINSELLATFSSR